ncbi:hypothetical protein Agub_g4720, partial [Astrephomene gubernaculifera]
MTKLHYLTSLSFGVHSPRRCPYRALLSDQENKRFVIIVLREEPQQADGRFGKALQHVSTRLWNKNNPFSWTDESPAHRVVALEIEWSSVVGIDYRCPLHDDGKLVLEARQVVKRCFKTVEDVREFYTPRASVANVDVRRGALSAAPTPSRGSLERRLAAAAAAGCGPGRHALRSPGSSIPLTGKSAFATATVAAAAALSSSAGVSTCTPVADAAGQAAGHDSASLRCVRSEGPGSRCRTASGRNGHSALGSRSAAGAGPAPGDMGSTRQRLAAEAGAHRSSAPGFASADEGGGPGRGLGGPTRDAEGAVFGTQRRLRLVVPDASPEGRAEEQPEGGSSAASYKRQKRLGNGRLGHVQAESPRRAWSASDLRGMADEAGDDAATAADATGSGSGNTSSSCRPSGRGDANPFERASDGAMYRTTGCSNTTHSTSHGGGHLSSNGMHIRGCSGDGCCLHGPHVRARAPALNISGSGVGGPRGEGLRHGAAELLRRGCSSARGFAGGSGSGVAWADLQIGCSRRACGGGGGGGEGSTDVPRPCRWTRPSATYHACTVVLSFRDPFLPQELRRFVKSDLRLLKLYESGLPSWAIFLPCYGLPYRPWMRRALWLLFIAISIFSMGCGFYDLYKNVPFLKQVVTAVASRLYLPAAELFEWLERHTQIRMSILLTYLFSKSPLLVSLMRMLRSLAALLQQLLAPAAAALTSALQPLLVAAQAAAAGVGSGLASAGMAVWAVAQPVVATAAVSGREALAFASSVLGPPARALWALAVFLAQLVRLVAALVGMLLVGPLQLLCGIGGALSWASTAVVEQLAAAWEGARWAVQWAVTLGRAARRVAPAVRAGGRAVAQAAAASGAGGGVSGGVAVWQWLGLEVVGAYNAVRLTFVQAFKSAQAVSNFCITVAQAAVQHRVSLLLQLRRFITRQKERLPPAMAASVPLPSFVSMPSFDLGSTPGPASMSSLILDEPESASGSPMAGHIPLFDLDMSGVLGPEQEQDRPARGFGTSVSQQMYGGSGGGGGGGGGSSGSSMAGVSSFRSEGGLLRRRPDPIAIPLGGSAALRRRRRGVAGAGSSG